MTYKLKRKAVGSRVVPPLLDKLASFVGKQEHGSLGWFEGPTIEPLDGKAMPEKLRADAVVFAWLPDGERVCVASGAVILVNPDGSCRLVAPSVEAFALAWAKGTSGVTTFDHDGALIVERHGKGAASTRYAKSARKQLGAWLKEQGVKAPKATFDLDAYLGTAPRASFDGKVPPPSKKLVADLIAGKRTAWAAYGAELAKLGHPIATVILADVAAMAEPKGKRAAKQAAKATFLAYVKAHLAPRYSRIAGNMIHFTDPTFPSGMGFRYGFLETLDTFSWSKDMVKKARELLDDDHARWAIDLTPRGMTFDDLDVLARLPALRRVNFGWSKVADVRSLAPLADLPLEALELRGTAVKDLAPLRKVPLVQLHVGGKQIVDLAPLAKHPTLECLDLGGSAVADVRPLMTCPRLCYINLWATKVKEADVRALVAVTRRKPKPKYGEYVISGYDPGVTHESDAMWVT
jgi:hypothetical protein